MLFQRGEGTFALTLENTTVGTIVDLVLVTCCARFYLPAFAISTYIKDPPLADVYELQQRVVKTIGPVDYVRTHNMKS